MNFLIYLQLFLTIVPVFLIFFKRKKLKSDYWLLAFFLLIIISTLADFVPETSVHYEASLSLNIAILYLIGPSFYHYILVLFKPDIRKRSYLHFLPLLFTPIILLLLLTNQYFLDSFWFNLFVFTSLASLIFYGSSTLNFIIKYQTLTTSYLPKWSKKMAYAYLFYFSISIIFAFSATSTSAENIAALIEDIMGTVALGTIVYFSSQISIIQSGKKGSLGQISQNNETEAIQETLKFQKIFDEIDTLVRTEKLFLDQSLTIEKLTKRTGINAKYISKAVNISRKKSFSNYINDYRIETFKDKIRDPKNTHLNLSVIALESGFNAKSSFNRIFKKTTGVTPSQFISSLSSSD